MTMQICEEMVKLRKMLNDRKIEWIDKSSIVSEEHIQQAMALGISRQYADYSIYRTHFEVNGYKFSVIYGYATYGGYEPFNGKDAGKLECMTALLNGGEPVGFMTAEDVMKVIDGKSKEDSNGKEA